jgi:hypothetical protein
LSYESSLITKREIIAQTATPNDKPKIFIAE